MRPTLHLLLALFVAAATAASAEVRTTPEGYRLAAPGYAFEFPRDHGIHSDFRTEWWYYTGNVTAGDGIEFGYELTIFRTRLAPPGNGEEARSALYPAEIYAGHFAISHITRREHRSWERLGRPGLGQASGSDQTLDIRMGSWSVVMTDPQTETMRLRADDGGFAIDLELLPAKPLVIHGVDGYHRKAADPSQASHYLTFTRLETSGTITWDGRAFDVAGLSWMDHEFGSAWLADDETGWDWFAIQLESGEDLMVYQLRRADGSVNPYSTGTLVHPDGRHESIKLGEYEIESLRTWTSEETGGTYPMDWRVRIPAREVELLVTSRFDEQEMNAARSVGVAYWEGAVGVEGTWAGRQVRGKGYVELVGYAAPMELLRLD